MRSFIVKYFTIAVLMIGLVGLLFINIQRSAAAQAPTNFWEGRVVANADWDGTPADVATRVLKEFQISGGVAVITACGAPQPIHFKARQGELVVNVLQNFGKQNPGYQWQIQGRTLDLVPSDGVPALLDTKIRSFAFSVKDEGIGLIFQSLLQLPEIQRTAMELHLSPGLQTGHPGVYTEHPAPQKKEPIKVHFTDLTLRDAFNRTAETFGRTVWVYVQRECDGRKTDTFDQVQY